MAAKPFDIPTPGGAYAFDIYNDAHALRAPGPALPGGPCNYTDPTLPRCGCRRFWSRASLSGGVFQENGAVAELCMCSHHACFHEDAQPGQTQQSATANAPGQENQKPVTNRAPLSPVQLPSFHVPGSRRSLDFTLLDFQTSMSAPQVEAANSAPAADLHPGQDSPMPDTFNNWGDLARSQAGLANGLPPFPTQCLMSPPPPPSTVASSQARYLRPFAGRGLHTLSGVAAPRPESRQLEPINPDDDVEPAQEAGNDPADSASTPKALPSQDRSVSGPDSAYQKLSDKVDTHEQRLDRLETNSFSVAGHDDCHDRHENVDLRVTELESRVDEVEKILNDNGSVVSSRRTAKQDGGADDATASVVSVSTNATVLATNRAEVYSQLQKLQAQVSQLQAAAMPSYAKPWALEVVFLPFPLKGVWLSSKEFANQRRSIGSNFEGWTQMPNTISRATPDPQSPKFQEWAGQGPESNWLLPRAFAAGRVVDQRLRSRGLIKTVHVRGADARSVQLAIHDAFQDVLRISSNSDARSGFAPDYPLAEYLGLRQAWVPLRKLHKDSRLRFLSPAEMATPALWDFTFLVSSVVMKATGVQRLYITQPEAYLQDHPLGHHAIDAGWTWQKLRQLSRVYPDSQSDAEVPEADALEECWNWNDRLDESPSVAASAVSLRQSIHQRASRRSSTEPSGQFYTGVQSPILSIGPSRSRAPSPLIQRERKGSLPPHIRTGSLPPSHPALLSPAQSRRRPSHVAATPYERRSSPFVPRASPRPSPRLGSSGNALHNHPHSIAIPSAPGAGAVPKRRFTRSPSLVPRNTPRWSRTSMSRSPSLAPGGIYGYQEERERENRERRTTTPFYYATPHSEAIPEFGYQRAGSRGPVPPAVGGGNHGLRMGGYDDELGDADYGDEEMDDFTTGSETGTGDDDEDVGDSEMTDHHHHHHHPNQRGYYQNPHHGGSSARRQIGTGSFGFGTDGDEADLDIDVYQDEDEDELDGVDTDAGNVTDNNNHHHPHHHHKQQQPLRPEDIPWAGIEDAIANGGDADDDSNMSDGENIDPTTSQSQSTSTSHSQHSRSHSQLSQSHSQSQQSQLAQDEPVEIAIHEDDHLLLDMNMLAATATATNNNNNAEDDDGEASSQAPSEYSSKPSAWQLIAPVVGEDAVGGRDVAGMMGVLGSKGTMVVGGGVVGGGGGGRESGMGFRIHEDGTAGVQGREELLDTQWG
ncbi:hypothetical protein B0I37DRAFT_448839 [Chaetomium sp. MPI-CAGE-AT-0009]|nr:hypothetical protein B0I37DRAFT_448839 [Chaetomium sp. MPI-CAGE-AT-0009]